MRRRSRLPLALVACVATGLLAGRAHAAPATASLESASGAGAGDCPGSAALAALVNDGIGRAAAIPAGAAVIPMGAATPAPPMRVAVTFDRAAKGYAAIVRIGGASGGTRKLANEGPGCAALANAVAVLLVVVLDTDDATAANPVGGSGAAAPPIATPTRTTAAVGVGGGVAEGLVGGWSPTVDLGGTLAYRHWAARLGGAWLPSKSNDFGPGRVEVGLALARAALCVSTRDDRSRVALAFCAQQQIGWMRGRGFDYDAGDGTADHLWLATGAAIVAGGPLGPSLGWEVDVGAVYPLREQRFVVDNLGTAYRSEPAAFMTTFAITTRVW